LDGRPAEFTQGMSGLLEHLARSSNMIRDPALRVPGVLAQVLETAMVFTCDTARRKPRCVHDYWGCKPRPVSVRCWNAALPVIDSSAAVVSRCDLCISESPSLCAMS